MKGVNEAIVAYFEHVSQHLYGVKRETHEKNRKMEGLEDEIWTRDVGVCGCVRYTKQGCLSLHRDATSPGLANNALKQTKSTRHNVHLNLKATINR